MSERFRNVIEAEDMEAVFGKPSWVLEGQWLWVNEGFDSERRGFTAFPPGRKGEFCIRNREYEIVRV